MKEENNTSKNQSFLKQNMYAFKLLCSISKKRVFFIAIERIIYYFKWLFFSTFFLKYIITCIEDNKKYSYMLKVVGVCCIIITIVELLSSYITSIVIPQTDAIIYKNLYTTIYKKARNVELQCYENPEFYSNYTMCMKDAANRVTSSVSTLLDMVIGGIASIAAFYAIISIDYLSGLFLIFPMIGNFYFGKLVNNVYYGREVGNIKNERRVQYINRVMYLADYAKEIRYSKIHGLMMEKFDESITDTVNVMKGFGTRGTIVMAIKNILTFPLPFEGIMIYAVYRTIVSKTMTLAELSIIYSTMAATSWILIGLFNSINTSMKNALNMSLMRKFLEYKEKVPEDSDGIIPDKIIHSIEFKNVSFGYKNDHMVLKNLNFSIIDNSCLALVGHNGSGKSTLIKLLLRLYDPTEGEILVNGIDIRKYNLREYRNLFSVAFQDYQVMAMSIKENIMMGNEIDDSIISKVLHDVELTDKVNSLAKKENSIMTREFDSDGVVFSGGQKQKLVVARALATNSPVKIFDEPSSALDPIAEYDLYNNILANKSEGIMIFISHRLSSVKDADTIFMFDKGELIEKGTHEELIKQNKSYAQIYRMQAHNYLAIENL